jgi:hypothetical protein
MSAYVRPASIEEALALLESPGAQPLAGGTDLVPLQSRGKAEGALVDVRALLGDAIEAHGDGLVIGAATRIADVASEPRGSREIPVRGYEKPCSSETLSLRVPPRDPEVRRNKNGKLYTVNRSSPLRRFSRLTRCRTSCEGRRRGQPRIGRVEII